MNVDHFFTIGSAHLNQGNPCEDYALSGTLSAECLFGVVADGCSGANANTDVGARALSWAFRRTLENDLSVGNELIGTGFHDSLLQTFAGHQYGERDDYLATVVGFVATPSMARVYVHGDGAVAFKYANGQLKLITFNWQNNMPFYLKYHQHPSLLDEFVGHYPDQNQKPYSVTTQWGTCALNEPVSPAITQGMTMEQVMKGHVFECHPTDEKIVAMAVITDGIEQVGSLSNFEVAREILAFKNTRGDFVKRRMLKALKTRFNGISAPRDDLGVSAIWFGNEE